jgi:hypothetical protein
MEMGGMLKMAGIDTHPAVRILIGVAVIALGIARGAMVALIVGGVLVVWGIVAVLSRADAGSRTRQSR